MNIDEAVEKFKESPTKLQMMFNHITSLIFPLCVGAMLSLIYHWFFSRLYEPLQAVAVFLGVIVVTLTVLILKDLVFPEDR